MSDDRLALKRLITDSSCYVKEQTLSCLLTATRSYTSDNGSHCHV